ncbi:MAG: glutamate--tRNA ligase [Bacillales bacterium]|jgi:glutamyl-tRNA synthetase|nr:glutamate--tRNA ligase [Bacillales bacterium]
MSHELAELLFSDVKETIKDLEERYPLRSTKGEVTRFAPSPTGFLHTGSLFTTLVGYTVAKQSKGVFYVRLEDTDTKREIVGSGKELLKQLDFFGLTPDEGYTYKGEKGNYGPYQQSNRASIYRVVIKELVRLGLAYPCFCTHDELEEIREKQNELKVRPGYYASYAKCRDLSFAQIKENIAKGLSYIIRFKSFGDFERKIEVDDLIRGHLLLSENDQDIVILKGDELPTYHFAHLVDDHFMRTTIVSRGEEWLPSLSLHLQLFNSLNWQAPRYAHLPVITKLENGNKRKLSKRKDNEAAVSYFIELGYPKESILQYLMTIANSNFEEWKQGNPLADRSEFVFSFEKMSLDGALFDLAKLQNISKNYLAYLNKKTFTDYALDYALLYDTKLLELIKRDRNYFESIINIEREKENPRKDYEKFSDLFNSVTFFYKDYYDFDIEVLKDLKAYPYIKDILNLYLADLFLEMDENYWFSKVKELGESLGFASNVKDYKKNPLNYKGHIGDICETIRRVISGRKQTPNLFQTLTILGQETIKERINKVLNIL